MKCPKCKIELMKQNLCTTTLSWYCGECGKYTQLAHLTQMEGSEIMMKCPGIVIDEKQSLFSGCNGMPDCPTCNGDGIVAIHSSTCAGITKKQIREWAEKLNNATNRERCETQGDCYYTIIGILQEMMEKLE